MNSCYVEQYKLGTKYMKYIRLYETSNRSEVVRLKLIFNQLELDYRVLFETMLDVGNVYGLGSKGVIVEVAEKDVEVAEGVLLDLELIKIGEEENEFDFISWFDRKTSQIKLFKDFNLEFRLVLFLVFAGVIILAVGLPILLRLSNL